MSVFSTPGRRAAAVALVAAGVALAVVVQAADGQRAPAGPATASPKAALTVTATRAERGSLSTGLSANGSIAAWQEAVVGAENTGSRLAEVRVNVGDIVQRGQVLATFVPDLARADLAQSKAAVAEAEATLADASANAQRARELQASGALSAQQINQFLTAERTAAARLEALRAAAQVQQLRLAQTQVLAPDSGVISARSATVGAVVPPGTELFRLIRQGRLEWRAEVAADELAQIKPGQAVRITAGGAAPVLGKVRILAPTVDAATRNGLVYVDLPKSADEQAHGRPKPAHSPGGTAAAPPGGPLKAGMFARGEFDTGSSSALTLPQSAVLLRDGFSYVFRLGADNKVTQTKVTVGRRVGERVEITAGLDPATRVVASGGGFLADGDTVRVVDAPAAQVAAKAVAQAASK